MKNIISTRIIFSVLLCMAPLAVGSTSTQLSCDQANKIKNFMAVHTNAARHSYSKAVNALKRPLTKVRTKTAVFFNAVKQQRDSFVVSFVQQKKSFLSGLYSFMANFAYGTRRIVYGPENYKKMVVFSQEKDGYEGFSCATYSN